MFLECLKSIYKLKSSRSHDLNSSEVSLNGDRAQLFILIIFIIDSVKLIAQGYVLMSSAVETPSCRIYQDHL